MKIKIKLKATIKTTKNYILDVNNDFHLTTHGAKLLNQTNLEADNTLLNQATP
jgi:hypothetical protein